MEFTSLVLLLGLCVEHLAVISGIRWYFDQKKLPVQWHLSQVFPDAFFLGFGLCFPLPLLTLVFLQASSNLPQRIHCSEWNRWLPVICSAMSSDAENWRNPCQQQNITGFLIATIRPKTWVSRMIPGPQQTCSSQDWGSLRIDEAPGTWTQIYRTWWFRQGCNILGANQSCKHTYCHHIIPSIHFPAACQ